MDRIGAELRRGVIQIVALALLRRKLYGYQLLKLLAALGLETEEGTLYPLLRRLESQSLLHSEWDTGGSRPRKYYSLSETGQEVLSSMKTHWNEIAEAVTRTLDGDGVAEESDER